MTAGAPALHVVGVRHHSPACARLVQATIDEVRPAFVLIEGPADFNARIDELTLGHAPPIAIFTHYQDDQRHHASWTPFCSYSPEWIAIEAGRRVGASVRFCDLPAWHHAFEGRSNRYGDLAGARERARSQRLMAALAERTHSDDLDVLWEHLFEQAMPLPTLAAALRAYFIELRGDAPGGDRDGPREAFMARWVSWALSQGDVVVVCGGWHAPAIEALVASSPAEATEPVVDAPPATARHGSELVPYAYRRLDAFAGYDAGMPSPLYQEWVWLHGQTLAAERAMRAVTERVRLRHQPLSTADLIAAHTMAQGLAALRGHPEPLRSDVLDGLAGAMVKDGLEVAMPWARRGTLSPRTHPLLVEVVAALSGDRVGRLAEGTPRPALFADIARELAAHALVPEARPRTLGVSLRTPEGRATSRVLHRLRVLKIPGFTRTAGPSRATDVALDETWSLVLAPDQEPAIIEAAQWGPSLEAAAVARLEAALAAALGRLSALASILVEAVFVGALGPTGLDTRVIAQVARAVGSEPSLAELGAATTSLLDLTLHGELLGAAGAHQLEAIITAAFDRGLWLLEGIVGPDAPLDEALVQACVALRDVFALGPATSPRDRAEGVLSRRAIDDQCPASLRGACLGALWSLDRLGDAATTHAIEAVRGAALPTRIGDLLTGLFATARAQVLAAPALLGVVDDVLCGMGDHEIMVALPSLRMAFAYFPSGEREHIARHVLTLHGADARDARAMVRRLALDPADIATGVALDGAVADIARRYGLETK